MNPSGGRGPGGSGSPPVSVRGASSTASTGAGAPRAIAMEETVTDVGDGKETGCGVVLEAIGSNLRDLFCCSGTLSSSRDCGGS